MAAKLTSTGVSFSDSTVLNSKYGIIPQSSVSIFFQAAAPTGWTKNSTSTVNDKALRVVSGTGGGTGGTTAFSSIFPTSLRPVSVPGVPLSGTVGNHTLTTQQLSSHSHPNAGGWGLTAGGGDVGSGSGWTRTAGGTGNTGGGGAHTHPFSGTCNFTASFDMRITYMDVIVCTFA